MVSSMQTKLHHDSAQHQCFHYAMITNHSTTTVDNDQGAREIADPPTIDIDRCHIPDTVHFRADITLAKIT